MANTYNGQFGREAVIQQHMSKLASPRVAPWPKFGPLPYVAMNSELPSVALSPANLIDIKQILAEGSEYIHVGKFLLARSIATPIKDQLNKSATWFVLDDPSGSYALPFYFIAKTSGPRVSEMARGTILALMNPLVTTVVGSENEALLCDNASHVFVLQFSHPLLQSGAVKWLYPMPPPPKEPKRQTRPSAESWREAGNNFFVQKRFEQALDCYNKAIVDEPKNALLFSNRSATYAMLSKFKDALGDAEKGLSLDPSGKKLLFRKAKALFLLKRYEDCSDFLTKDPNGAKHGADREFAFLLAKANRFCRELRSGDYEQVGMYHEMATTSFLDHAEYFDPSVLSFKRIPGGYEHGVVALKAVEPGSLLCASKALAYCSTSDSLAKLAPQIQKESEDRKTFGCQFFHLFAGHDLPKVAGPSQPIDAEERSRRIVANYTFTAGRDNRTVGFWLIPSFFNYTCVDANCDRYTIGDFLFIRATRRIVRGEQCLLQLRPTNQLYEKRASFYLEKRGYSCRCRLCTLECSEAPSVRNRIKHMYAKLDSFELRWQMGNPNATEVIDEFSELLRETRNLRPDCSTDPLPGFLSKVIGKMKMAAGKYKEALKINRELLALWESLGWTLDSMGVTLVLSLNSPISGSSVEETNKWKAKLRSVAKVYYGDENLMNLLAPIDMITAANSVKMNDGLFGSRFTTSTFRL